MRIDEIEIGDRVVISVCEMNRYMFFLMREEHDFKMRDGDTGIVVSIEPIYEDVVVVVCFDNGYHWSFRDYELQVLIKSYHYDKKLGMYEKIHKRVLLSTPTAVTP